MPPAILQQRAHGNELERAVATAPDYGKASRKPERFQVDNANDVGVANVCIRDRSMDTTHVSVTFAWESGVFPI
jgi:hypothetical protein